MDPSGSSQNSQFFNLPILIIDDIEDNRDLLEEMLRDEGYQSVVQAESGMAGLEMIATNKEIALVLLDLQMPVMDGYATCQRITENPASTHVPVIVVTGGAMRRDEALRRSFECGAMDFLPKPVNEVELFGRVKSALMLYLERIGRQRKTEELLESQQRYDLAVNGVNDGIWDINVATKEVFYSPKWKQILGYEDHEFLNEWGTWQEMVHPDDRERVMRTIRDHWDNRTPYYTSEHRLRTKKGEYIWVFSRGRAIWDAAGNVIRMAGSTTDITHRKSLEIQLRQSQQLESIGRLAAGVAHDFNNLLTTILGQASLGRRQAGPDSPLVMHFDKIERASLQAADFCKQMLAYAGQGCYSIERLNLNEIVQETADLVEISISKKIELHFALWKEPVYVDADPSQLRQVLLNLYLNAAEAVGPETGFITARSAILPRECDLAGAVLAPKRIPDLGWAKLEVQDTGSGMTPETQAKIFEPFFTTKFTGRGLGLSAVLGIIRAHEGALEVRSRVGEGTTFAMYLPLVPTPAVVQHASTTAEAMMWRGTGKILLVDDEAGVREIVSALLEELGFTVVQAQDGLEAVTLFAEIASDICVVILDLNMPKLNGAETFARLREIKPDARVLLATGYGEQEAVRSFAGKGLAGFLQKPFKFTQLEEKLRICLQA